MTLKAIKTRRKKSPPKPIWDLYRDGLTQGAINKFLTCREQFYLSVVLGWVSKQTSEPLEFGSAFHDILAKFHQKSGQVVAYGPSFTAEEEATALTDLCDKAEHKARKGRFTAQQLEDIALRYATLEVVLKHYLKFWADEDLNRVWVKREETFHYDCLYGPHPEFNDLTIPLRGRWDGVFRKNGLWLLETKTKGQIDEDGIQASLPFDVQTMLYNYVLWKTTGEYPAGVIYDVVRRPGLRRGASESFLNFVARIDKDIADRPDHYFKRWKVGLSKKDLTNWEEQFLSTVLIELEEWWGVVALDSSGRLNYDRHFLNPNALFSRYGKCDLFRAITEKNYSGLKRLKKPFPELRD